MSLVTPVCMWHPSSFLFVSRPVFANSPFTKRQCVHLHGPVTQCGRHVQLVYLSKKNQKRKWAVLDTKKGHRRAILNRKMAIGNCFPLDYQKSEQYLQITISPLQIHPVSSPPNDDMCLKWRYLIMHMCVAPQITKCRVDNCLQYIRTILEIIL